MTSDRPDWITDQNIAETIEVWQPYYERPLTTADAIEILVAVDDYWGAMLDLAGVA